MEYRKYDKDYVLRLDPEDEVMACIKKLCEAEKIKNGRITGLGAAKHAVIGLWDIEGREFKKKELAFPMEVASLIGDVSEKDGEVYLHVHGVVADEELRTYAGHLAECVISATAEIIITGISGNVGRKFDDRTGLNIYDFEV